MKQLEGVVAVGKRRAQLEGILCSRRLREVVLFRLARGDRVGQVARVGIVHADAERLALDEAVYILHQVRVVQLREHPHLVTCRLLLRYRESLQAEHLHYAGGAVGRAHEIDRAE